jgi:thioredoxin-like negative regulator of GroEL
VAAAERENKLVVVDFGAPWCGPCKLMERTTWVDPGVTAWLSRNAVRVHVNIEERRDLKQRFDIAAVPTAVVLRDRRELGRFTGSRGAPEMVAWLDGLARASAPQRTAAPPSNAARASAARVDVVR